MFFRYTLFCLLVLGASACTSSNHQENTNDLVTFTIPENPERYSIYELVDKITVQGLEETPASLLGMNQSIYFLENRIAAVDFAESKLHFFNSKGEYMSSFSKKGEGPEEYSSFWDVQIVDDQLLTLDLENRLLKAFGLDGEFISNKKLPVSVDHSFMFKNELYLNQRGGGEDSLAFHVVRLADDLTIAASMLPVREAPPFPMASNLSTFKTSDNRLFFKEMLGDTIFEIGRDKAKPAIHFGFEKGYLWQEYNPIENTKTYSMNEVMDKINQGPEVWIFSYELNNGHIYLSYNTSFEDVYSGIIDRKTGTYKEFRDSDLPRMRIIGVDEATEEFIALLNFESIEEMLEKDAQLEVQGAISLEEMMNSENPIIGRIKFK